MRGETLWNPEPGEEVTGIIRSVDLGASEFHTDPVPVLTLDTGEGPLVVIWVFFTSLLIEIQTLEAQPGDRVTIRRAENSTRHRYRRYRADMAVEA